MDETILMLCAVLISMMSVCDWSPTRSTMKVMRQAACLSLMQCEHTWNTCWTSVNEMESVCVVNADQPLPTSPLSPAQTHSEGPFLLTSSWSSQV